MFEEELEIFYKNIKIDLPYLLPKADYQSRIEECRILLKHEIYSNYLIHTKIVAFNDNEEITAKRITWGDLEIKPKISKFHKIIFNR